MGESSLSTVSNGRVALAFLAAPTAAVVSLGLLVFVLLPLAGHDPEPSSKVALHFALFGAIIIFPVAIAAGLPLFLLFKFKGWLSRRAVFIGGLLLSLAFPAFVSLKNPQSPGFVTVGHYSVCAVCGVVAAWVFCAVSGLSSRQNHGSVKP